VSGADDDGIKRVFSHPRSPYNSKEGFSLTPARIDE
jgi:hypothetical protein